MYDLIDEIYSQIFPPSISQCSFIIKEAGLPAESGGIVLDIGCATGDLAFELAEEGCIVTGIDLDPGMAAIASEKAGRFGMNGKKNPPDFRCAGMTEIGELFSPESLDAAICFGNTLPHLPSSGDVLSFLSQVYSLLKPGGSFIFQIINFDKITGNTSFRFPDITVDTGTFRRKYIRRGDGRLDFIISLEKEGSALISEASVPLLPLQKASLISDLEKTGFNSITLYSDYNRTPASGDEHALIFSMKK